MENGWQETKKEYEINDKGEYIARHITFEKSKAKILGFEKKDFWEQIIKSIGIVAIIVPLILFKCSRDADIESQKNVLQLELFSNILSDIQRIILLPDTSIEFKNAKQKLDIEYFSKITLLGNDSVISTYRQLKDTINIYTLIAEANHLIDTVIKHIEVIQRTCTKGSLTIFGKDSAIRKSTGLLERSAKQWVSHFNLINSLNKKDSLSHNLKGSLFDAMLLIRRSLNVSQPSITAEVVKGPIRENNIRLLDSVSNSFLKSISVGRLRTGQYESHYKEKIEIYFDSLNIRAKNLDFYKSLH